MKKHYYVSCINDDQHTRPTTHAAPRSTSAGPVCRPTLKRSVPMAYSSGTAIAFKTALTLAAASPE